MMDSVIKSIGGLDVQFPFEPYGCQVAYMTSVIECLQKVGKAFLNFILPIVVPACNNNGFLSGLNDQTIQNKQQIY